MVQVENDEGADERDANLAKREAGLAAQVEAVGTILEAARKRDIDADARDQISAERDQSADLKAFTSQDGDGGYGTDLPARRHAALDRLNAKGDRASAADDRVALAEVADDPEVTESNARE